MRKILPLVLEVSLYVFAIILALALVFFVSGCAHPVANKTQPIIIPSTIGLSSAAHTLQTANQSDAQAISVIAPLATNATQRIAIDTLETNQAIESNTIASLWTNTQILEGQISNLVTDNSNTHAALVTEQSLTRAATAKVQKESRINTFVVFLLSTITTGVFLGAFWKPMTGSGGWISILVALVVTGIVFAAGCAFWYYVLIYVSQWFPAIF